MNPFDTLGMYDNEMHGLFSKVKKAVKKVAKKVEKVGRAVRDKTLPSKVSKELSRAAKNPIVKGAALAVAATFAGPLVAGAASKLGVTVATKAITAKTIATGAIKGAAKGLIKKEVGKKLTKKQQEAQKKIAEEQAKQLQLSQTALTNAANTANQIIKSPEVQNTVGTMIDSGATPGQVVSTWVNSQNYHNVASQNAAAAVYPQIYDNFIRSGATPEMAQNLATQAAQEVGEDAANTVKANTGTDWGKIAAIGLPVAAALLIGG